jgi:chemotaxis protein MotB
MQNVARIVAEKAKGYRVVVEGHTDSSPIQTKEFPSNWELSGARSGAVVRLMESRGFPRKDLRSLGLADTEPLVSEKNAEGLYDPEAQAKNRRIVVKVQRQLPKRMK